MSAGGDHARRLLGDGAAGSVIAVVVLAAALTLTTPRFVF